MEKKTTLFKKYIEEPEILIMPGAHDALCARIIERSGIKSLTTGGYAATSSLLGRPDLSLLSFTELVDFHRRVADSVNIPILADGDTGFGGIPNVIRTVREFERAGVAGMFIEDQDFPKRCGHMEGKKVIKKDEMVAKIMAAVDTRIDKDFIIMARTDALAVYGIDDAIERANTYREAGADLLFVEAPQTVEEMEKINSQVEGPTLANNIEAGKSPLLSASVLQDIGYNVVVFPVAATYAITKTVTLLMNEIKLRGTTEGFLGNMTPFDEFNEIVGLLDIRSSEDGYYARAADLIQKKRK